MKPFSKHLTIACCLAAAGAAHAQYDFKDWSATFSSTGYAYSNTSTAGTISGWDAHPAFANAPGNWGMPLAITPNNILTNGFQIHGLNALGSTVRFDFSPGYQWGSGGQMLIGNIHNGYEYTLEAWDFNGTQLDVNLWNKIAEYDSSAAGTSGYFSTSWTSRSAAGLASRFYVNDPLADPNLGQGGIVHVGGLHNNIARIDMTLSRSDLIPNAQQVDLLFFNVATPVPEPATLVALGAGLAALLARRKR